MEFSSRELPPSTCCSGFNEGQSDSPGQEREDEPLPSPREATAKPGPRASSGGENGAFNYETLSQWPSAKGSFNWLFLLLVY